MMILNCQYFIKTIGTGYYFLPLPAENGQEHGCTRQRGMGPERRRQPVFTGKPQFNQTFSAYVCSDFPNPFVEGYRQGNPAGNHSGFTIVDH